MVNVSEQIEQVAVAALMPYARNSRTHSDEQVEQIARSIREFGFTNPVLIDGAGEIVAGHGRILGARKIGMEMVPCIRLLHLSEAQRRAYVIADNKLAMNAGWDDALLSVEIKDLADIGFDLTLTGFSDGELADLLNPATRKGLTDPDDVPEVPAVPVSKPSDVWLLGRHRLMCGDSINADDVARLMCGQKADMVFTDPPYNVDYGSNKNPRHKIRTIENDNMTTTEWDAFTLAYLSVILSTCDGNIYIAMSDKELGHLQQTFILLGGKWASFIIWVKDRLVLSPKDFHSRHETLLYGWKDGVKHRIRVEDRTQDDVWEIPRPSRSDEHPTMKPVALPLRAIENSSHPGGIVFDPFMGGGSTLLACEKSGRQCRGIEIAPQYVDVVINRWQNFTGLHATLENDGRTFNEIAANETR